MGEEIRTKFEGPSPGFDPEYIDDDLMAILSRPWISFDKFGIDLGFSKIILYLLEGENFQGDLCRTWGIISCWGVIF